MQNKSAVHNQSSENAKSREESCHHHRHMSGIALKVYDLFWRLGKKSKDGTVSLTNQRIAKLIGVASNYTGKNQRFDHITRAKTVLQREGWFEFLGVSKGTKSGTWQGGRYRAISHSEWVEVKEREIGHSPCHPEPLQSRVSSVHPGGRAFQSKRRTAEARTVNNMEARTDQSHRAGREARTDLRAGSTSTVRGGKHAQSVDFSTGVSYETRRAVAVEEAAASSCQENQNPSPQKESKEAWEAIGEKPFGPRWFVLGWEKVYRERPEGELLEDTMEEFIQWCQRQEPERVPPGPFFEAKRRVEQQEAEDDSEITRIPTSADRAAEAERMLAKMEAEQGVMWEAETARFNALSQEEKLAELTAKLVGLDDMLLGMKRRGTGEESILMRELKNQKAELERQIAELSSPVPEEEPEIDVEMARQLLSQFPETWDAVDTAATKELGVAA